VPDAGKGVDRVRMREVRARWNGCLQENTESIWGAGSAVIEMARTGKNKMLDLKSKLDIGDKKVHR
jgi:hypothetical protein